MKRLILLISVVISTLSTFGQSTVVIKGYSECFENSIIKIYSSARDPINGIEMIGEISIDSLTHHFFKSINIPGPMLIYLKSADFTEAFVSPGDTIDIAIKKNLAPISTFNGFFQTTNDYFETVSGRSAQNNFFSLLENKTGKFDDLPFLIGDDFAYEQQLQKIKEMYTRRLVFFNEFEVAHPELSVRFKHIIENEITGQYVYKLILITHQGQSLPDHYLDEIKRKTFLWQDLNDAGYLFTAAINYFDSLDNEAGENYTALRLEKQYNNLISKIEDKNLRDYLITHLLFRFLDKSPDNFQQIFEDFKNKCTNVAYIKEISERYSELMSQDILTTGRLSDSSLNIPIIDAKEQSFSLAHILKQTKKKLIVIDFWASWCGPCLMQMPYLNQLEKKYESKVAFISLSSDGNQKSWLLKVEDEHLFGYQYRMNYELKYPLINQLNIKVIPRYILLDNNGKLINVKLPMPSDAERINRIIENALQRIK